VGLASPAGQAKLYNRRILTGIERWKQLLGACLDAGVPWPTPCSLLLAGAEPMYHHQYSLPARPDQYYLQSASILPVPVLGMQGQLVQSGLQNYAMASQGQLASVIGLPGLEGGADGGADANPSKPLRPTARSVHLGMHPAGYQIVATSAAEPAMGGKVASGTMLRLLLLLNPHSMGM
jgi:hypothetical protein